VDTEIEITEIEMVRNMLRKWMMDPARVWSLNKSLRLLKVFALSTLCVPTGCRDIPEW
jgi:hypothetical protein